MLVDIFRQSCLSNTKSMAGTATEGNPKNLILKLPIVHRCLHYDSCDVQID